MNLDFFNIFNPGNLFDRLREFFKFAFSTETIDVFTVIFTIYTIYLSAIIVYSIIRIFEIREREHEHLKHEVAEYAHHQAEREKEQSKMSKNIEWNKILEYTFSNNVSDWKLAILTADSMLDRLITQLGFRGEDLGEKLKSMKQDSFKNLTGAWEVHLIRNKIAHDASFDLSQREAKRVIAIYEQIFREFDII